MNRILSRPARAALPVALAACALLVPGEKIQPLLLMAAALLARICSLCAGAALRAAAAKVVSDARLRGNFLAAIILALIGGGISAMFAPIPVQIAIAGALINISQVICDRLYVSSHRFTPVIYDLMIAAAAVFGLFFSQTDAWLIPAFMALAPLTGAILMIGLRGGVSVKPGFRVLVRAPIAIFRSWLFPAALICGAIWLADEALVMPALLGAALLEGCEPQLRRSADESSAAGMIISLACAAAAASAALVPRPYLPAHAAIILAGIGAIFTGLHIGLRRIAICVLILLSAACVAQSVTGCITGVPQLPALIAALTASAAQLALCLPDANNLRRTLRARRIQKRRQRRR